MSRSRWRPVVPAVATAAGLLFGISASTSKGTDLRSGQTDLVGLINDGNAKVARQQREVQGLRKQVQDLTAKDAPGTSADQLTKQASAIAPTAGLSPVSGEAMRITLSDSTRDVSSLPEGGTADWLVVHQQDVQGVVNALWQGGASAMMLMDQRVISTSAVRCVGNTLILQGRVYSPPFTITAIGDPGALRKALDASPAVRNYRAYVDIAGLGYKAEQLDASFPAYSGSLTLRYAKPAS